MSTVPTTTATIPSTPFPGGASPRPAAGPAGAGASSIDPVKLLNRHKWLLVLAGVFGGAAGTGLNYALEELWPLWKPIALFQTTGPIEDIVRSGGGGINDIEMNRFMQTQIRFMTSDTVLQRVAEDPQLQQAAPAWSQRFKRKDPASGLENFDSVRALRLLKKDVSARALPSTTLIELSFTGHQRPDSTAIVGLVREKYMAMLASQGQEILDARTKSLRDTLRRIDDDAQALQLRRKRIIETDSLESVDERADANQQRLQQINEQLLQVEQALRQATSSRESMAAEMDRPSGYVYNDQLQQAVERDPLILDLKGRVSRYEDELKSMLNMGKSREHREYKAIEARLAGATESLDEEKQRLLKQLFGSQLDELNKLIIGLEAQRVGLTQSREEASRRQVSLTQLQTEVTDIKQQVDNAFKTRATTSENLQEIISLSQLSNANRVVVYQAERPPSEMSFPQLKFMIPVGIIAGIGLLGAAIFLREIVDNRVKSPSDINLMPRMKLLGWVPDASEDPEGKGAAETAFRDRPKGVVAESFRQLRSTVAKRLDNAGHKTVLILGGMPGSGSTSVVANMALAMAAADKRVLVIDANLRRPMQQRVFGVQESPGLADVLAGTKTLDAAIQKSSTPNVDVLSVGSKELRVVERLAAPAMSELLAKAKATYDVIFLDVAPAIVAGDAMALAQRVDSSILVVRAMSDKRGMVSRIRNELGETRGEFLGAIVNGVKGSSGGYMRGNIKAAADYAKS